MTEEKIDYPFEDVGGPSHLYRIDEVYVFVSEDEKGEGVCGLQVVINDIPVMMPMIAADKDRLDSLIGHAKNIARRSNKKIKLIKLSHRTVIQEIIG